MQEFILKLVKQIVDNPDDVSVVETTDQYGQTLNLSVNQTDMGKVIGRSGRIIRALRDLLRVKSIKEQVRTNLTLLEKQ